MGNRQPQSMTTVRAAHGVDHPQQSRTTAHPRMLAYCLPLSKTTAPQSDVEGYRLRLKMIDFRSLKGCIVVGSYCGWDGWDDWVGLEYMMAEKLY